MAYSEMIWPIPLRLAIWEYSLDGSTWFAFVAGVNGYDLVEGWHRVDLTALLSNPVTFRPLQDSNELQIRRQSGGASKKATIDAQLSVATFIQAVALL